MDDLPPDIAAILAFNETAAQFFSRVQQERVLTGLPIIDNNVSLRPGVVLEVAGPPGSCKTELLLSVALHVLLAPYADPSAWSPTLSDVPAGPSTSYSRLADEQQQQQQQQTAAGARGRRGGRSHVVVLDLDGKFDGVRLMQVLEPQVQSAWRDQQQQRAAARQRQIHPQAPHQHHQAPTRQGILGSGETGGPGPPPGAGVDGFGAATGTQGAGGGGTAAEAAMVGPDEVVEEVLSRLHLVRCHSSLQLLAALVELPARLEAMQRAYGGGCRLLLLDNVGAHYWRDRAARNVAPGGGGIGYVQHSHQGAQQQQQQARKPGQLAVSLWEIHAAIAARLSYVARRHRLPVVATKTTGVTARGLDAAAGEGFGGGGGAGDGGEGPLQLQQREFMPMPWQNIVTNRLLLYPRGVVPGPGAAGQGTQRAVPTLTAVLAEMQGSVGAGGPGAAAAAPAGGTDVIHGGEGPAGGRAISQLLVSTVAMVEDW